MGTPEYMAPEQAAGHPADPRSDIYAVGSIMYEMLTGKTPFEGDNVMEVLHKKANEPPTPLIELRPGLPPMIVTLVERAMAHAPEDRPSSMADLAREIRAVETSLLTTPPPVAVPPANTLAQDEVPGDLEAVFPEASVTRIVSPFASRRRLHFGVAGAAVVVVVAAGLWLFRGSLREKDASTPEAPEAPAPVAQLLVAPPFPGLDAATEAAPPLAPEPVAPVVAEPSEPSRREPSARPVRTAAAAAKEEKDVEEALRQARQLLHAQRYDEARAAFTKLLTSRQLKGAAAAGLAKIAFQEKDYKQTVERAKESVRTGGGVEARVLLGDAYFKLDKLEEAKKAYNEVLKLDPNNRLAGQGLRLVESRLSP
jgi:serine/threonine-protein kinase